MKLTAKNVKTILEDCLFRDGEDTSNAVIAEVVMSTLGFHPERLESHKAEIAEMLSELPNEFRESEGGGWSFLNAYMTKDGEHWGEHPNIDELLALGVASGLAKILLPRSMWAVFPGGLPYFSVSV